LSDYAESENISLSIDQWRSYAQRLKHTWPLNFNREASVIQQAEVLETLDTLLPEDVIITTGVGNHQLLAAQYIRSQKPRSFLTPGSFGTMGFGMPAAVGAHKAHPETPVYVIDGDGSFRMNMGELHTIGTNGLPIKILLLNNHCDGMVHNLEDVAYAGRHSATERSRDIHFAQMAKVALFPFAQRVADRSELKTALEDFVAAQGPALLEVITDPTEALYPVVRPGTSYADMELGPYIHEIVLSETGVHV
jgi:acetolactate synthase-1/2/3 large subunit